MNRQLNLLKDLKDELKRIEKLKGQLSTDLKEMPDGSLMKRTDGRLFHVVEKDGEKNQIRMYEENVEDEKLAFKLKYKRYIKEALPVLETWIKYIDKLLKHVSLYDPLQIERKLKKQYHGLKDVPIFLEGDINPYEWKEKSYPTMYKEGLIHPSEGGIMTRSKSEAQIASKYESLCWKFEYEPIVELNDGRILRPDFRIMHPYKRKLIYHEHLGMMDDPEYAQKAIKKIEDYASIGIHLRENLVLTIETKKQPLTYKTIDETVKKIEMM